MRFLIVFVLLSLGQVNPVISQTERGDAALVLVRDSLESNSVREEVQRYFGYEDLLYRYLTIPYDMNQNVNQVGRHVDMGFVFLTVWPLLVLVLLYRRKKLFYTFLILTVLYLLLALNFSHIRISTQKIFQNNGENWASIYSEAGRSGDVIVLTALYDFSVQFMKPVRAVLDGLTGSRDHITYAFLISLFIGILYWFVRTKNLIKRTKTVVIITFAFGFLWWILGGGIIWYGMLMIPLGYLLIGRSYSRMKFQVPAHLQSFSKNLIILVICVWALMAYVERISYVNIRQINTNVSGQEIANPALMYYTTGLITEDECREISAKNVAAGIRRVNSDDRYVYQVGTHLIFDIKNNHKRVFEDNTLSFAFEEIKSLDSPNLIVQRLKSRGFGYILLDLNTHLLDRTPEKSLVKKYQIFLQQLYNNPEVSLVATDREVIVTNSAGQKIRKFGVVGEEFPTPGNYAIYEIL